MSNCQNCQAVQINPLGATPRLDTVISDPEIFLFWRLVLSPLDNCFPYIKCCIYLFEASVYIYRKNSTSWFTTLCPALFCPALSSPDLPYRTLCLHPTRHLLYLLSPQFRNLYMLASSPYGPSHSRNSLFMSPLLQHYHHHHHHHNHHHHQHHHHHHHHHHFLLFLLFF